MKEIFHKIIKKLKTLKDLRVSARLLQKVAVIGGFITTCIVFIYSLGYMTDLDNIFFYTDPNSIYVKGSQVYFRAQSFNAVLFKHSLALLIVSLTMFVWFSHKRKYYYLTNYITTGAVAVYLVVIASMIFTNNASFKSSFLNVDFETWKGMSEIFRQPYTESTLMLDLGFVVGTIMIIFSVLLVLNLVLKFVVNRMDRAEEAAYYAKKQGLESKEEAHAQS